MDARAEGHAEDVAERVGRLPDEVPNPRGNAGGIAGQKQLTVVAGLDFEGIVEIDGGEEGFEFVVAVGPF